MSERENRRIILRTNLENEILVFEVEDNGVGMEYEVKQKVFTTFFTTKGGIGTGLGLLTTRRIVQEHGGTIDFESIKAKGSIFRMEFLLKRPPKPGFTCRDRTLFCPHIMNAKFNCAVRCPHLTDTLLVPMLQRGNESLVCDECKKYPASFEPGLLYQDCKPQ